MDQHVNENHSELSRKDKQQKIFREIRSWVVMLLSAIAMAILLNSTIIAQAQVDESSMENTLFDNERLIVDKITYRFTKPKRGDIIIFLKYENKGNILSEILRSAENLFNIFRKNHEEELHKRLVKRVIGVEGDEIDIKDGYVYLNGEPLEEPYAKGDTLSGVFHLPVKVGKNQLFVLGDNRMVSSDSREFGLVDIRQVEGKAVFRVYPLNQIGVLK